MAIIDSYLRLIILKLCLNIEHFSKVKLLNVLSEEKAKDGCEIVKDYVKIRNRLEIEKLIERNARSIYCKKLYAKYPLDQMPVWVFIELISFGMFIDFLGFCAEKLSKNKFKDKFKNLYYLLQTVKLVRNAAAHNNCIINDVKSCKGEKDKKIRKDYYLLKALKEINIGKQVRRSKLSNLRIYQIITCLYVHKLIVSSIGTQKAVSADLQGLKERFFKNYKYSNSLPVKSTFEMFISIIDSWYKL